MNNILLTGADGFLGKHTAKALKQNNIEFQECSKQNFDITNKEQTLNFFKNKNFETIIHLAGNIRTKQTDNTKDHFNINTLGTYHILEAMRVNKIKKIILASSVEVYSDSMPSGVVVEYDSTTPSSDYGKSKLEAENHCRIFADKFGIKYNILRFTYLYGKGMHKSRIIPRIIESAKNKEELRLNIDSSAFFDMLYAGDGAKAIISCLSSDKADNRIMNISSNKKTTIKDVVSAVQNFYPDFQVESQEQIQKNNSYIFDNSLAKKLINFNPQTNLKQGLKCSL